MEVDVVSKMNINRDNVEFKNEKRFLSNMYPCNVTIDNISYPSSENFYMSMKFKGSDDELCKQLQSCSPLESKKLANSNKDKIRDDWDDIKLQVMSIGLMAKFSNNLDLAALLVATDDDYLEERNDWNDTYWGTYNGTGENNLGKLLMKIRGVLNV